MIGRTLSHYEIVDELGAGGMGEVYRATDTKLGRDVAIKVLAEELRQDEERLARLEREARALAALNHPNIGVLYGLESDEDITYLVMELVPGDTLEERLRRGPLAVVEALEIFEQIAGALEAAHAAGIIHRDLKPANIKITPEGRVKVLDFGLAKAFAGEDPVTDLSSSPTRLRQGFGGASETRGTAAGVIMGTASYMSPEQAKGKAVDKRADIWAFGCVLFEAIAGRKAFDGESVTDVLANVIHKDPPWEALPADTPWRVRDVLRRCLTKDARQRFHDTADARIELSEKTAPAFESRSTPYGRAGVAMLAGSVVLAALAGVLVGRAMTSSPSEAPAIGRFSLELTSGTQLALGNTASVAISPDGETIAFIAAEDGQPGLYVRDIESFEPKSIAGTGGVRALFFSPDGAWIGYFDGSTNEMKKVRVEGGAPIVICKAGDSARGASWGADDTIYFNNDYFLGLYRVSASGGEPELLTTPDRAAGEKSHRFPEVLPDGRSLLFE